MAVPEQTSSSLASTSSSSTVPFHYDVFLSFRGEDTRKNFTDHLYTRLVQFGINTFRDDEKLDKGEEISWSLPEAIKKSRISIIVFSRNYASSTWCLRELEQIMECKRQSIAQTVLPIFLEGADPSNIRNQAGSFGEALVRHRKKFGSEVVEKWRKALKEAAGLSGWDQKTFADGHESKLIDEVVLRVLSILNPIPSDVVRYPIGIDSRVKDIMRFLSVESKNVMIIGILGMGGIGKTTIAKAVYYQIIRMFEGSSFLEGVREASKTYKDLVKLQRQLLHDIFKEKIRISNVSDGKALIKRRVCAKKVLVVLDDVDDNDQIEALAGGIDWFGLGSKVIITTRNEHVLNRQKVNAIYRPEELDTHQSIQLLSYHAFTRKQPPNDFLDLAKNVAHATGGLPLALEILGCYLSDKNIDEWNSALKRLKEIPNEKIQEKLKISYDALNYQEKELFLDIACFFIGTDKEYVNCILEVELNSIIGIKDLIQKSLVKISINNKLTMHDLLRDMGREIVRNESPDKPWERSRVWSHEQAFNVLQQCKGTSKVKGLFLNFDQSKEIALEECHFSPEAFEGLDNLRLLHLDDAHLVGDFNGYLSKLRWLKWRCPSELLPTNFYPKKLTVLDLSHSKIRHWDFADLKVLNLSSCHFLTRIPQFFGFPNLETLNLESCVELLVVDESIENLKKLVHLNLRNCKKVELPSSICKLGSLQNLRLDHCSILPKLLEQMGLARSLTYLSLDRTNITELPDAIGFLKNLKVLRVVDCEKLVKLPVSMGKMESLKHLYMIGTCIVKLPEDFGQLLSLRELNMEFCHSLKSLPANFGNLVQLSMLSMEGCGIIKLPDDFGQLSSLDFLSISDCEELESLPENFGNLVGLSALSMRNTGIHKLPEGFRELTNLAELDMSHYQKMESLLENGNLSHLGPLYASNVYDDSFASGIGKFSKLQSLYLSGCNFYSLPTSIRDCSSLEFLFLDDCTKLQVVPELPSSLISLNARNCISLERLPNMSDWNNLRSLTLPNCTKLSVFPELPSSLEELDVRNCKSLERFPDGSNLRNIKRLFLTDCTKLRSLLQRACGIAQSNATNCMSNSVLGLQQLFPRLQCLCFNGSTIPDRFIPLQFNQCPDPRSCFGRTKTWVSSSKEEAQPGLSNTEFVITRPIICVVPAFKGGRDDPTTYVKPYVKVIRNDTIISDYRVECYNDGIPLTNQDHGQTFLCLLSDEFSDVLKNRDRIRVSLSNSTDMDMKNFTSWGDINGDGMSTIKELLDLNAIDYSVPSGSGLGEVDRLHEDGSEANEPHNDDLDLIKVSPFLPTNMDMKNLTSWGDINGDGMSAIKELLDLNAIDYSVPSGSGLGEVDRLHEDGSEANEPHNDDLAAPHSLNASSSNICFDADDYMDLLPPNPKKPKTNTPLDLNEEPDVEFSLNLNNLNPSHNCSRGVKGKGFIIDG